MNFSPVTPQKVIHDLIPAHDFYPNNSWLPLLVYKQVFTSKHLEAKTIQAGLHQNDWQQSWVDSIYDYHHYHSNTHEVLVIISGDCQVQFGGERGPEYYVQQGDVVILPAGVAHKSGRMSSDFKCIGAYPFDVGYDMNYGSPDEYPEAIKKIQQVGLPKKDPMFGEQGILFDYWK